MLCAVAIAHKLQIVRHTHTLTHSPLSAYGTIDAADSRYQTPNATQSRYSQWIWNFENCNSKLTVCAALRCAVLNACQAMSICNTQIRPLFSVVVYKRFHIYYFIWTSCAALAQIWYAICMPLPMYEYGVHEHESHGRHLFGGVQLELAFSFWDIITCTTHWHATFIPKIVFYNWQRIARSFLLPPISPISPLPPPLTPFLTLPPPLLSPAHYLSHALSFALSHPSPIRSHQNNCILYGNLVAPLH